MRIGRLLSNLALLLGVLLLAWIAMTALWKEPITSFQADRAQGRLQEELEGRPIPAVREFFHYVVQKGQAAGRITIPSIDVDVVFVEGTGEEELKAGPGHYPRTSWPGQGKVVAIAGHRTTYGAWFRHIDELGRGDRITLRMPYGRYEFRVASTKVVDDTDWSILDGPGEFLVLSACHPLYSASQRIVVTARPV